jgi:YHS domain-containing protein
VPCRRLLGRRLGRRHGGARHHHRTRRLQPTNQGFDPVAYFIDETPLLGRPDFELRYRGAIWRFRNPGNRAAFVENPGDYEPRFGAYDPVAISRAAPTPGNPEIWLILGGKLYLFYDPQTRDEFRSDPRRLLMQAEARWPDVIKVLSQ